MRWLAPWFLLFVPALVALYFVRRRSVAHRPASLGFSTAGWLPVRGRDRTRLLLNAIYLLAITLAAFALGIPGNQLSRKVEASADEFALELTDDPPALIDLQTRLARSNLSDPDPPDWYEALFATHPSTVERIGAALASERR